jgi:hypothetical protein
MVTTDRRGAVRFAKLFVRPFEEEFGDILVRLERHSKIVDRTAVATELLRADEFRKGNATNSCSPRS